MSQPYLVCMVTIQCSLLHPQLTNLSNIDLANITRLQPESVIYMSRYCKKLHCVNVSLNSVINDECVTQLAVNLPKLSRLYCVSCNISDRGTCRCFLYMDFLGYKIIYNLFYCIQSKLLT